MALTGEAKAQYQREYMRRRRAVRPTAVRPSDAAPVEAVRPSKPFVPFPGVNPNWHLGFYNHMRDGSNN